MKGFISILVAAALWAGTAELPVAPIGVYKPTERKYWAFQPRKDVTPPSSGNPIDAFILDGLKKAGLTPAPPADRLTLIRRITYDLTGLPPTPEEVDAFLHDA